MGFPRVEIIEESMREGMQIESVDISVAAKIALLDALSETGLSTIVVGSFVSPKWTPQMADIEEIVRGFTPKPGVTYTGLALNQRGRDRMRELSPPLSPAGGPPRTLVHLCDVFVRRNTNRSQQDEIDALPGVISGAVANGAREAGIAINAAWGSNWIGPIDEATRMQMLERQHDLWTAAGVPVRKVWLGDPMAWNVPQQVASQVRAIVRRWPDIHTVHLHLHNARGSALVSTYAALQELDERHTLIIDSSVGGLGGCPYGGHGRMTRMIPTEDLVDMLDELGIKTGVDLGRLIEVAHLAEDVVGHELWGHVSKAGPRPRGQQLFPMDLPFIETPEQAQHFRLGPDAYRGVPPLQNGPITSPARPE